MLLVRSVIDERIAQNEENIVNFWRIERRSQRTRHANNDEKKGRKTNHDLQMRAQSWRYGKLLWLRDRNENRCSEIE